MYFLLILTLLLTPTYNIRFSLFGFPVNFLMLWVILVWAVFAYYLWIKNQWPGFVLFLKQTDKKILVLTGLFFLAGLVSLFAKGFDLKKLGQFIVLFLQPISIFFIGGFVWKTNPEKKSLILNTCYLLLAVMGLYAVIQYFTGLGLPLLFQGNPLEPRRAVSFFIHPNFYALFSAPLLAFLIPDVALNLKSKIINLKLFAWLLGALGLLLSLSRAGWLGLVVAIIIYLIASAGKKIWADLLPFGIAAIIVLMIIPSFRSRILLPFEGEKSANSRITLWEAGVKGIKESPVFGLGLTGFSQNYNRLITDHTLDPHNFPHNIFLDLWVEAGLLGLISLVGLGGLVINRGLRNVAQTRSLLSKPTRQDKVSQYAAGRPVSYGLATAFFLLALISQGLIDNPYFKNDLAMVFWIIMSLTL